MDESGKKWCYINYLPNGLPLLLVVTRVSLLTYLLHPPHLGANHRFSFKVTPWTPSLPLVGPMPFQVFCCFSRQFLVVSVRWRHWQDHPPGFRCPPWNQQQGNTRNTRGWKRWVALLGFGLLPGAMLVIGSGRFWVYFDWLKIGIKVNTYIPKNEHVPWKATI